MGTIISLVLLVIWLAIVSQSKKKRKSDKPELPEAWHGLDWTRPTETERASEWKESPTISERGEPRLSPVPAYTAGPKEDPYDFVRESPENIETEDSYRFEGYFSYEDMEDSPDFAQNLTSSIQESEDRKDEIEPETPGRNSLFPAGFDPRQAILYAEIMKPRFLNY